MAGNTNTNCVKCCIDHHRFWLRPTRVAAGETFLATFEIESVISMLSSLAAVAAPRLERGGLGAATASLRNRPAGSPER